MNAHELAEQIFRKGTYKALCYKITGKELLAEELHSEFLTAILEIKDDRLSLAKEGGYLDVFCVGIIHNIWGKRGRVKSRNVGTTSPLFEYSSTYDLEPKHNITKTNYSKEDEYLKLSKHRDRTEPEEFFIHDGDEGKKILIDYNKEDVERIIKKEKDHPDKERMYTARVFYHSYFTYSSPMDFARASGISHNAVYKACHRMKEFIKKELKCSTI